MTIQAKPHRTTHQRVQQSVQHVQPQPQKKPAASNELESGITFLLIVTALFAIYTWRRPAAERSYNWVIGIVGWWALIVGAFAPTAGEVGARAVGSGADHGTLVLLGAFMMFLAFVRYCWHRMARSAGKHFAAGAATRASG